MERETGHAGLGNYKVGGYGDKIDRCDKNGDGSSAQLWSRDRHKDGVQELMSGLSTVNVSLSDDNRTTLVGGNHLVFSNFLPN